MEEKKERQRKILPPLEELIGGSTSDLVSEALKKVLPYPPDKKKPKSEPHPTLTSTETKSKEGEQKQKKKGGEKAPTRAPYTRVQDSSATASPSAETPVPSEPRYQITERQRYPAAMYPTTTYVAMPQSLVDEVLPTLNTYEQVLLVRLYRLSYGFGRDSTDHIGKKTLADKCNMSLAMVKKVLKTLEGRGLIEKILDRSNNPTKGNKYTVLAGLAGSPAVAELGNNKCEPPEDPS
jgi:hypothetical protein